MDNYDFLDTYDKVMSQIKPIRTMAEYIMLDQKMIQEIVPTLCFLADQVNKTYNMWKLNQSNVHISTKLTEQVIRYVNTEEKYVRLAKNVEGGYMKLDQKLKEFNDKKLKHVNYPQTSDAYKSLLSNRKLIMHTAKKIRKEYSQAKECADLVSKILKTHPIIMRMISSYYKNKKSIAKGDIGSIIRQKKKQEIERKIEKERVEKRKRSVQRIGKYLDTKDVGSDIDQLRRLKQKRTKKDRDKAVSRALDQKYDHKLDHKLDHKHGSPPFRLSYPSKHNTVCGRSINVKILFIRHGFSCANMKKYLGGYFGKFKQGFTRDPVLTAKGVNDAERVSKEFAKFQPDIVMSSMLTRAIETALYLFPNKTVYVAPFIREKGNIFDSSNRPSDPDIAKKKIAKNYQFVHATKKVPYVNVDYSFVTGSKKQILRKRNDPESWKNCQVPWSMAEQINYGAFLNWLACAWSHMLSVSQSARVKSTKELRIAVVGHGRYIRKYVTEGKVSGKPQNISAVEMNFCLGAHNFYKVPQVVPGKYKCEPITDFKSIPGYVKPGCDKMYYDGFPVPTKQEFGNQGINCDYV